MRLTNLESTVGQEKYARFSAHFDATADPRYQDYFRLLDNPDNDRLSIISTLANVLAINELPELPLPVKSFDVTADVRIRNFRGTFAQVVQLVPIGRHFRGIIWRAESYGIEERTKHSKVIRQINYSEQDTIPWMLSVQRYDANGNLVIGTLLREYTDHPEDNHAHVVVRAERDETDPTNDDITYAEVHYGRRVIDTRPLFWGDIDLANDLPFWQCVKDHVHPRQLTISSQIYTGPLSPYASQENPRVLGNGENLEDKTLDLRRPLRSIGIDVGPGTFVLKRPVEPVINVDAGALVLASSIGRFVVAPSFNADDLRKSLTI